METQTPLLDEDPWYGWESEESDQGWLLSYVDVLSVILAMLLVLLVSELRDDSMPEPTEPTAAPIIEPEITVEPAVVPVESSVSAETVLVPVVRSALLEPVVVPAVKATSVEPTVTLDELETIAPPAIEAVIQPADTPSPMRIDGVTVIPDETGITVKIAEVVLFDSARADLKPGAGPVLTRVAMLLHELGEVNVAVEGHTDNRQIQGGAFESNWQLAAARSSAVTAFLLEYGLAAEHLRVVSYADTRPIADNGTARGRASNRRVELRVTIP